MNEETSSSVEKGEFTNEDGLSTEYCDCCTKELKRLQAHLLACLEEVIDLEEESKALQRQARQQETEKRHLHGELTALRRQLQAKDVILANLQRQLQMQDERTPPRRGAESLASQQAFFASRREQRRLKASLCV